MLEGYEIKERSEGSANILKALAVREACKSSDHMNWVAMDGRETVAQEQVLLESGNRFYADGYRLRKTGRKIVGSTHTVPKKAIAWVLVSAGFLAGVECDRIEYITKS